MHTCHSADGQYVVDDDSLMSSATANTSNPREIPYRVLSEYPLAERGGYCLSNANPGQRYGFRAHGAWDPGAGTRYNAAKLLVDPYARGLDGVDRLDLPSVHAYGQEVDEHHRPVEGRRPDPTDSRSHVPHSVVLPETRPAPDTRPRTPWASTVVYEATPSEW